MGLCAADQPSTRIADFEGPSPLQNWRASSDAASLSSGPGRHGNGAVLTYRLPCSDSACGSVDALFKPNAPLPKRHDPAISLWAHVPPATGIALLATDSSGQNLAIPLRATLEPAAPGGWRYFVAPVPLKKELVEIGIRVQPVLRSASNGTVSFDEISLRDLPETFHLDEPFDLAPLPAAPGEPLTRMGVNIHLLRDDPALELAHTAGFSFVRMDMLWSDVERAGRFRFGAYDALLRALEARGMSALWILDYGHPDHGGGPPRTFQDVAAFGRFAEAAAAHFRDRNVAFEIWNEPDTAQFWAPAPNPSEYGALLRAAVAAIHRADPNARIVTGGVSGLDAAFLGRALDPDVARGITALGVHPYAKGAPEIVAQPLDLFREWAARGLGERVEIWDTEWGYSSSNAPVEAPNNGHSEAGRKRQACLAVRELLAVWATGLTRAVYYDLRDDGTDAANPEHNYGLLDSAGNEKPALKAIGLLTGAVRTRKIAGMAVPVPAGIHALRLDGPADTLWIVWTDQPKGRRKITFAKAGLLSATDLWGKLVKLKDSSGLAQVELDEAAGPVYLVLSRTGTS